MEGHAAVAEAEYRQSLAIVQRLAEDHPVVPSYRRDRARVAMDLAAVDLALGQHAEARVMAEKSVALSEALLAADSRSVDHRGRLAEALLRLGQTRLVGGDPVGATSDWRCAMATIEAMPPRQSSLAFVEAGCHAMMAGVAGDGGASSGGSAAAGPIAADRAMDLLRRAVATGCRDAARFRTETGLAPLRHRAEFRLLMMDLQMPDEPFAPRSPGNPVPDARRQAASTAAP